MFQHRHFKFIAETIAKRLDICDADRERVALAFAGALRDTNPNFNRARFIAAATGNPINGRDK